MSYYALPKIKPPQAPISTRTVNNRIRRGTELQTQQQALQVRGQMLADMFQPVGSFVAPPAPAMPVVHPGGMLPGFGSAMPAPARLPGFAGGGEVYSSDEEEESEEEKYQRFLASEAAGREAQLYNQYKAAVADPATAQIITQVTQPQNIPQEAFNFDSTWQATQGPSPREQLQTQRQGETAYGELPGKIVEAGANTALSVPLIAAEQANNLVNALGSVPLPVASNVPTITPRGELKTEETETFADVGAIPIPGARGANEYLGAGGAALGRGLEQVAPFMGPLPWAASELGQQLGVGPEEVGREVGRSLLPENLFQAVLMGAGAVGAKGGIEALTGLPVDDALRRWAVSDLPEAIRYAPDAALGGARAPTPTNLERLASDERLAETESRLANYLASQTPRAVDPMQAQLEQAVQQVLQERARAAEPPPGPNITELYRQPAQPGVLPGIRGEPPVVQAPNVTAGEVTQQVEGPTPLQRWITGEGPLPPTNRGPEGELLTPQQRVATMLGPSGTLPGGEPMVPTGAPLPTPPAAAPANLPIGDQEKFDVAQLWARDQENPAPGTISLQEMRTRLYNAGIDPNLGTDKETLSPAQVRDFYRRGYDAGVKMPAQEVPSGMPDAFDLARTGRTPQAPTTPTLGAMPEPPAPVVEAPSVTAAEAAQQVPPPAAAPEVVPPVETRSQAISRLIREAGESGARTTPYVDVSGITVDDAMAMARKLGVQLDEEALRRGTELTKQQELAKLQTAADEATDAANALVRQPGYTVAQEQAISGLRRTGDPVVDYVDEGVEGRNLSKLEEAEVRRVEREGGAGGTGDVGRQGATRAGTRGGNKPTETSIYRSLWNGAMEAAYLPLSSDVGTILRQDVMQTLNPFYMAQTKDVAQYAARAAMSQEGAEDVLQELLRLPRTSDAGLSKAVENIFADVNGTSLTNRETYMSNLVTKVPGLGQVAGGANRANAMWLNARRALMVEDFLTRHPNIAKAQALDYVRQVARVTGRGDVGDLSALGPFFTSLRFMASMPQRAGHLNPIRNIGGEWVLFGPAWKEAMKSQAGFAATLGATMLALDQAGVQVGWDPRRDKAGPHGEPPFGSIRVGNSYLDLSGGTSGYLRLMHDMITGTKGGKPYPALWERYEDPRFGKQYRGALLEFLRNKSGPLPGLGLIGMRELGIDQRLGIEKQTEFLRPEYWDRGFFESGEWYDRLGAQLLPLAAQGFYEAGRENGGFSTRGLLTSGLAGGLGFIGAGLQSYARDAYQGKVMRADEIMQTANARREIFGPQLASKIGKNETFADLSDFEKEQVLKKMSDQELKAWEQQGLREGDKFQIALSQREGVRRSFDREFTDTQRAYMKGEINPFDAKARAKEIENRMYARINAIEFPKYEAGKKSDIQKAEEAYKGIGFGENAPRKPDGKPDYEAIKAMQDAYLASVTKKYGADFADRLSTSVAQRENTKDHKLQQFYDTPQMRAAVTAYNAFNNAPNVAELKSKFLEADPARNALLYAGGNAGTLRTPAALEAYRQYSAGVPDFTYYRGMVPEAQFRSYNQIATGPLGAQVREYQNVVQGKKDDYLKTHPELNVLLYQTRHTGGIYSVSAWEKLGRPR